MALPQPMTTVADIDEALWWVTITAPRDAHYPRIIDSLLDQRSRISADRGDPAAHRQGYGSDESAGRAYDPSPQPPHSAQDDPHPPDEETTPPLDQRADTPRSRRRRWRP